MEFFIGYLRHCPVRGSAKKFLVSQPGISGAQAGILYTEIENYNLKFLSHLPGANELTH